MIFRTNRRNAKTVLTAVLGALVLSACSTAVPGTAVRDPGFDPMDANPALMRPGNYPTKPGTPPEHNPQVEVLVEGQRMADYVVGPWEVDPTLLGDNQINTLVLKDADAVRMVLVDPGAEIARNHGFINGFVSDRYTRDAEPRTQLGNAVLRFPTPDAAGRAAGDFATQLRPPGSPPEDSTVPIPGHPETQAFSVAVPDGRFEVRAFTARGSYVLVQQVRVPDNPDTAARMIAQTLDLQGPRIDEFVPTDPAQFATMDLDPSGLLIRTVPADKSTVNMGVWSARAVLHFQYNPVEAAERFTSAGLDFVSIGRTRIYQTRDADSAVALAEELSAVFADGTEPGPEVPGLPAAQCFIEGAGTPKSVYGCIAPADRWVIESTAIRDFEATQLISAQYLLVTAK